MKTIIHVNQHIIKKNKKNSTEEPVLTCKTYKENKYASEVEVYDKQGTVVGRFVYRPSKPLSCGAHVWFETECDTKVIK